MGTSQAGCWPCSVPEPPIAVPMGDDIEWLDLPGRWTYGVCGDGRVFFIKYSREIGRAHV